MMLRDVMIPAGLDWDATASLAEGCFPGPSRGIDEAATVALGREFLRVLMLAAVSHGRPDLEHVRHLVDMELARPGSAIDAATLAAMPSAGLAVIERVRHAVGSGFCEPVIFLGLNLTDASVRRIACEWRSGGCPVCSSDLHPAL